VDISRDFTRKQAATVAKAINRAAG
jgi:hypothetical protein